MAPGPCEGPAAAPELLLASGCDAPMSHPSPSRIIPANATKRGGRKRTLPNTTQSTVMDTASAALARLSDWVGEVAGLTQPDRIHWVNGSDAEYRQITDGLVAAG